MFIKLTDTFAYKVDKAIEIAKKHNLNVIMERNGVHFIDDLYVVLKFQNAGFLHRISAINNEYDENALQVEFYLPQEREV